MSYSKTVTLPVTPDEAFTLITEPERLRRWQVVSASVDLRAGGDYRWTVTPGHVAGGTFREVEPGRRVVFGWGWDGSADLPPDASLVTITVEPVADGSRVTLVHEGLTDEQAGMHAEGWDHYLDRLVALASTGDAGPDEWAWSPEHLDQASAADAVLAALQPVLRGITPAHRANPTPCADFSCHDLVEHLATSMEQLAGMAGVAVVAPKTESVEDRLSSVAAQAIDAWRTVDLDGTVPGPGGEMPAAVGAAILPVELLLHGWDLAQGTQQRLRVSDEVVTYVQGLAETIVPGGRRGGSFGEEVAAPQHADALERLAAYSGRRPVHA